MRDKGSDKHKDKQNMMHDWQTAGGEATEAEGGHEMLVRHMGKDHDNQGAEKQHT